MARSAKGFTIVAALCAAALILLYINRLTGVRNQSEVMQRYYKTASVSSDVLQNPGFSVSLTPQVKQLHESIQNAEQALAAGKAEIEKIRKQVADKQVVPVDKQDEQPATDDKPSAQPDATPKPAPSKKEGRDRRSRARRERESQHDKEHNHENEAGVHRGERGHKHDDKEELLADGRRAMTKVLHPELPQCNECAATREKYGVLPGYIWGNAPSDVQSKWKQLNCDKCFLEDVVYNQRKPGEKFGGRPNSVVVLDEDVTEKPEGAEHIAFLMPMTSAASSPPIRDIGDFVFWPLNFHSFLEVSNEYLMAPKAKYIYTYYIGYDEGDPVLDNQRNVEDFADKIFEHLDEKKIPLDRVGVRFFRFNDTVFAPSWAVNHLAQAAFDAGVEWMYQINDDVEHSIKNWEDKFTSELRKTKCVGVTGPTDNYTPRILTQSFVHRTHVAIFDSYFSPIFHNWWSDDWLTATYGKEMTHRSHGVTVKHHASQQRYPTSAEDSKFLADEIGKGMTVVRAYIEKHKLGLTVS